MKSHRLYDESLSLEAFPRGLNLLGPFVVSPLLAASWLSSPSKQASACFLNSHFYCCPGDNPHLGHLAWADTFIVTADSVSMLSEACSTGKPVYVVGGDRCRGKIAAFHRTLQARGATRPFTGSEDVSGWGAFPLQRNFGFLTASPELLSFRQRLFPEKHLTDDKQGADGHGSGFWAFAASHCRGRGILQGHLLPGSWLVLVARLEITDTEFKAVLFRFVELLMFWTICPLRLPTKESDLDLRCVTSADAVVLELSPVDGHSRLRPQDH